MHYRSFIWGYHPQVLPVRLAVSHIHVQTHLPTGLDSNTIPPKVHNKHNKNCKHKQSCYPAIIMWPISVLVCYWFFLCESPVLASRHKAQQKKIIYVHTKLWLGSVTVMLYMYVGLLYRSKSIKSLYMYDVWWLTPISFIFADLKKLNPGNMFWYCIVTLFLIKIRRWSVNWFHHMYNTQNISRIKSV